MSDESGSDTSDDPEADNSDGAAAGRIVDEEADNVDGDGATPGRIVDDGNEDDGPTGDRAAITRLRNRIGELEAELETRAERIEELEASLDERDERIEILQQELLKERQRVKELREQKKQEKDRVRRRTTDSVAEDFCDARDNLVRALVQGEGTDIRDGVEATLKQFDDVLNENGIVVVDPALGDEVEPTHHEVVDRVPGDQPEGTVQRVYRHGYEREEQVIRPARVAVSDGSATEGEKGEVEDGDEVGDDAASGE